MIISEERLAEWAQRFPMYPANEAEVAVLTRLSAEAVPLLIAEVRRLQGDVHTWQCHAALLDATLSRWAHTPTFKELTLEQQQERLGASERLWREMMTNRPW